MNSELVQKINQLKREKNAVILVHNYQRPEIYAVADFIGDSLELSRQASSTKAGIILFCGVDFMAETAKILSPNKKVLIPALEAQCPMAKSVTGEQLKGLRKLHPNAAVVSYVNTSAETKAESDICCTSSNCVSIANSLPQEEIIFVPDRHLAAYVQSKSSKKIIPWGGSCYVHSRITLAQVNEAKKAHPSAKLLVHPECPMEIIRLADYVCSTSQMIKHAKDDSAKEFIVVTEHGMAERLRLLLPGKKFIQIDATCIQQKKNTLQLVLNALESETHEIKIKQETMGRARNALLRMLESR